MKDKIVFSTNPNYSNYDELENEIKTINTDKQNLRIWLEKRPGNKIVSIIKGYIGTDNDLKELSKVIKKRCGVGGSEKNGDIIVQTKDRQKVLQILNELGYFAKLSGG